MRLTTIGAVLRNKRAAAATLVALTTPALLAAAGFGVEAGLLEAKRSQTLSPTGSARVTPTPFG